MGVYNPTGFSPHEIELSRQRLATYKVRNDSEREVFIHDVFKRQGIEVRFED